MIQRKIALKKILITIIPINLLLASFFCNSAWGGDLAYIDISDETVEYQQVDAAARFYGINLKYVKLDSQNRNGFLINNLRNYLPKSFIISARALPFVNYRKFQLLLKNKSQRYSIMIIGITPQTERNLLKLWSGGTVEGVKSIADRNENTVYKIENIPDLCFELAGKELALNKELLQEYPLDYSKATFSKAVIYALDRNTNNEFPIFIMSNINGTQTYFAAGTNSADNKRWQYSQARFMEIAPLMMFLRFTFGQQCWHGVAHYANLTIDDPWLIEPYGYLSYVHLLSQMQKVNFHTTIAFIPWNFDRNRQKVINIFKEHPERFSISIHGDDHDQYEFELNNMGLHESKIKQALARMDKFTHLTGLNYDKVMIFPHNIGPLDTLKLLKKYNFIATTNGNNIPLGEAPPEDPVCRMRGINNLKSNFPSLPRISPEYLHLSDLKNAILIDIFLNNPVVISSHHALFKDGITAFNPLAEFINKAQPDMQWKSLGYIAQHEYLTKVRDNGENDILTYSSDFILENSYDRKNIYHIQKEESFELPIRRVTVNNQEINFEKLGQAISIVLMIPPHERRHISIEYVNNLDLSKIDISKNKKDVFFKRYLSDFRDIVLPRVPLGDRFVRDYYNSGVFKLGLIAAIIFLSFFCLLFMLLFYVVKWLFSSAKKVRNS